MTLVRQHRTTATLGLRIMALLSRPLLLPVQRLQEDSQIINPALVVLEGSVLTAHEAQEAIHLLVLLVAQAQHRLASRLRLDTRQPPPCSAAPVQALDQRPRHSHQPVLHSRQHRLHIRQLLLAIRHRRPRPATLRRRQTTHRLLLHMARQRRQATHLLLRRSVQLRRLHPRRLSTVRRHQCIARPVQCTVVANSSRLHHQAILRRRRLTVRQARLHRPVHRTHLLVRCTMPLQEVHRGDLATLAVLNTLQTVRSIHQPLQRRTRTTKTALYHHATSMSTKCDFRISASDGSIKLTFCLCVTSGMQCYAYHALFYRSATTKLPLAGRLVLFCGHIILPHPKKIQTRTLATALDGFYTCLFSIHDRRAILHVLA